MNDEYVARFDDVFADFNETFEEFKNEMSEKYSNILEQKKNLTECSQGISALEAKIKMDKIDKQLKEIDHYSIKTVKYEIDDKMSVSISSKIGDDHMSVFMDTVPADVVAISSTEKAIGNVLSKHGFIRNIDSTNIEDMGLTNVYAENDKSQSVVVRRNLFKVPFSQEYSKLAADLSELYF